MNFLQWLAKVGLYTSPAFPIAETVVNSKPATQESQMLDSLSSGVKWGIIIAIVIVTLVFVGKLSKNL